MMIKVRGHVDDDRQVVAVAGDDGGGKDIKTRME